MEIQKMNYYEKAESRQHREFIKVHSHCILCGTVLELHHIKTDAHSEIKEEAHCPECGIKTRSKIHQLN